MTEQKHYYEDSYFLEFKDEIFGWLEWVHNTKIISWHMHFRKWGHEFDVFILTKKLKIGIEIKEANNYFKVFEQALERLPYVDYMYVLIGWNNFVPLTFSEYFKILECYSQKYLIEDIIRIGIMQAIISRESGIKKWFVWKRAYTSNKAKKVENLLKYFKNGQAIPII